MAFCFSEMREIATVLAGSIFVSSLTNVAERVSREKKKRY